MQQEIAQLNLKGKLQTNVEEPGMQRQTIHFEDVEAVVSYGFPQHDGEVPPGTADGHGRVMVAEIAPLEFLVTGVDASVTFQLTSDYGKTHNEQLEIVRAEQGHYESGVWKVERIWNGDQTDRGLNFKSGQNAVVRIRLHRLPLMIQ